MQNTTRRNFLSSASLGIGALFLSPTILKSNPLIWDSNFKEIRKGIGYFTGGGGTIGWLMNKEGTVVIDSQFPDYAAELINTIHEKDSRTINLLINTHHHSDHTAGNIAFKGKVGHVLAHKNSRKNQLRVAQERGQMADQLLPDLTFSKDFTYRIGDEVITCTYHGRGHTDGDIITHFENANVVHMGDLVFNRKYPYIDKSAGASIANWIEILEKAQNLFEDDTIFIFGHADNGYEVTGTKQDLKAFQNYLTKLLAQVRASVKIGRDLDQIKSSIKNIMGAPGWKGEGIERSLSAAYEEIKNER